MAAKEATGALEVMLELEKMGAMEETPARRGTEALAESVDRGALVELA